MATATNKQANITPEDLKHIMCLIPQMNLNTTDKDLLLNILNTVERLIEMLKSSKVSIHRLKALMGFKTELLKKLEAAQE
jgi:hypothetical protein